jgi:hypothetical protein
VRIQFLVDSGRFPSIFVVMRDIHGIRGEAWLQPPFLSVFSDPESRVVAKADPGETGYCWELNRAQDVFDVLMAIAPMFTANRPSLCQVENLLIGLFTGSLVVVVAPFHKLLLIKYFVESVACFPPSNVAHRILQAA